jgi:hypothetical protein
MREAQKKFMQFFSSSHNVARQGREKKEMLRLIFTFLLSLSLSLAEKY